MNIQGLPDWLHLLMMMQQGQHGWGSVADWSTPNPYNLYTRPIIDKPQQFNGLPLTMNGGTPDSGSINSSGGAMPLAQA